MLRRKRKEPIPLSQVLKNVLDKKKLSGEIKRYELFENWGELVGPKIAERTHPIKVQGNQLILGVDHPAWIQELHFLKAQLLEKIQENYPESRIKNLRFTLR